ncbi:hypothetical protein WOLCODRAFT_137503 [Wolfiporia cocos MD-104 SS10]|uniref:Protein-lysine N-methyltransferase EFM6 n=1 Tax=Wolfiporia cocos (strain MD-104) TaxID=742152 RepID=A0A2H3JJB0_WOLCO|nr:hypothetical protein WOLCODRAFT_137503 [Wolfiporia cocos MD-104 SS10]
MADVQTCTLLSEEEKLDALDPLRHLRAAADDTEDVSDIVPAQRPSILNQTVELAFSTVSTSADRIENNHVPEERGSEDRVVIKLMVDASPGCGGVAWPAGEVLSRYIARRGLSSMKRKTVLELGSGTGLVGLVAGKLGGDVWITDQAPLLDIMRRNVIMNDLSERVRVAELDWGTPIPFFSDFPRHPDVILAADCVYFEPAFPLLVQTLAELVPVPSLSVTDAQPEVLFCYKKRRKADKRFFALLKKEFSWTEVADDPDHEVYTREAISLLRLIRRSR